MSKDKGRKKTERQLRDEKIDKLAQEIQEVVQAAAVKEKFAASEIQLAVIQVADMVAETISDQHQDSDIAVKGPIQAQQLMIQALALLIMKSVEDQRDEDQEDD